MPGRLAPRPRAAAGAVHQGRSAPGRRDGGPRLGRHRKRQLLRKQRELFLATVTVLAQAVEMRDQYTGGHTARVTEYSLLLATQLNLSAEEIDLIRMGTPLHDIGKIGIDDKILRKPGKLTPEEFEIMKTHTDQGGQDSRTDRRAGTRSFPSSARTTNAGTAWAIPTASRASKIPRLARIVAVADAFDAMTSDRPYRPGMAPEVAFAEVDKQKGKQFDPEAAAAFLSIHQRVLQQMQNDTKKIGLPGSSGGSGAITYRLAT